MSSWPRSALVIVALALAVPPAAAQDSQRPSVGLQLVGDLDGDGLPDVVGIEDDPQLRRHTVVVSGRRGYDGQRLWSATVPGVFATVEPVGVGGERDGVLVSTLDVDQLVSGDIDATLAVLDADGTQRWSAAFEGDLHFMNGSQRVPYALGVVHGDDGADVVVVQILSFDAAGASSELVVLDAQDGTERSREVLDDVTGPTARVGALDDGPLPDLVAVGGLATETSPVTAVSVEHGAVLWQRDLAGYFTAAFDGGDVNGDGVDDVVVGRSFVPGGDVPWALLSGADGEPLWTGDALLAYALGDQDGDGRGEVGVVSRGDDAVTLSSLDADGVLVPRARTATPASDGSFDASVAAAGDIDSDGLGDVVVVVSSHRDLDARVPFSRSLLSVARPDPAWTVASAYGVEAYDGRGHLLEVVVAGRDTGDVTTRDAATGAIVWRRVLDATERVFATDVRGVADLDGDGDEETVATLDLYTEADVEGGPQDRRVCGAVLDGAAGATRWTTDPACDEREPATGGVTRLAGSGRAATAAAVSAAGGGFPGVVVLARDDAYADALAAAPLARLLDAPILYTSRSALPDATAAELDRLQPRAAVVLGGPGAIGQDVVADLTSRRIAVRRIAGTNRFATAAALALEVGAAGGEAFLVQGADEDPARGWPDALAAAPLAALRGLPLLLTNRDTLPPETAAVIDAGITSVTVVGGPAAVSDAVVDDLRARGVTVRRVAGSGRYETAVALHALALAAGADAARPWLATGRDWADALTAGAAVARRGDALLLIDGLDPIGSGETHDLLGTLDVVDATLLGGPSAITPDVEAAVRAELSGGA